ncbi:MAG: hypothetical protein INR63_20585, partial [Actinomycetospora chiangmaiensis]|nr:hypothetical protein [Actinomycetospora chiangmaiensis]
MNRTDAFDWAMHYGMRALPMTACSNVGARLSRRLGRDAHPAQQRNALGLMAALRPDWDEAARAA